MKIQNVVLKVVGVTFKNDDGTSRSNIITEMAYDESSSVNLKLEREPHNQYDTNAVKVIAEGGQIGYIGKDYASIIASMMDQGTQFIVTVEDCGEYKGRPYCQIRIDEV